jgi:quercetin dioxygenase-like cupin family protein
VILRTGDVFEHPETGSRLEILATPGDGGRDVLVVERLLKPGKGRAGAHLHRDFVHSFEVLDGRLTLEVDGEERTAAPGERVSVPIGTPHRDPYNASGEDLRIRTEFEPVPDFVDGFTAAFGHLLREGRTNENDFPPQLQLFVCLHAFNADSWGVGPPIAVQRMVVPLLAFVGRLRGYRVSYDSP